MTEVKFEFFAKKKDDPSEPKPLRIHKGELYHKPNEFGIDVETCNQDVSIELVITPKGYKEARAIGLGCTRIKPIKRTRKRQIAKAKHMMAWQNQQVTSGHSGDANRPESQRGGNNDND